MKLSFIIPCYRSEHTLAAVVEELEQTMTQRPEVDFEIVLTEDGSPDRVWDVIAHLADTDSHIKALRFTRNFGQHAALLAGLSAMTGDAAFFLDDDGQAPLDELFKLVDKLGSLDDAVKKAAELAKLDDYHSVSYPVESNWLDKLLSKETPGSYLDAELRELLGDLYQPLMEVRYTLKSSSHMQARLLDDVRVK